MLTWRRRFLCSSRCHLPSGLRRLVKHCSPRDQNTKSDLTARVRKELDEKMTRLKQDWPWKHLNKGSKDSLSECSCCLIVTQRTDRGLIPFIKSGSCRNVCNPEVEFFTSSVLWFWNSHLMWVWEVAVKRFVHRESDWKLAVTNASSTTQFIVSTICFLQLPVFFPHLSVLSVEHRAPSLPAGEVFGLFLFWLCEDQSDKSSIPLNKSSDYLGFRSRFVFCGN